MRPALQEFLRAPTKFTSLIKPPRVRPSHTALVQTDGSFSSSYPKISRTAVILNTKMHEEWTLSTTYSNHKNSGEAEWCSVLDGIKYAIKKGQFAIELENDNLGVIQSLIHRNIPKTSSLSYYYLAIYKEITNLDYIGARWIPRELNKADELFRL